MLDSHLHLSKIGQKGRLDSMAHIDTSTNSWLCLLWSQQRVEYIWTPHIMAHSAIMWCGNGRETTCHCGWQRDSRTEARPRARSVLQFTLDRSLISALSLAVSVILRLFSLVPSTPSPLAFQIAAVPFLRSPCVSLIFPDSSTLTHLQRNVTCRSRQCGGYCFKGSIS